MKTKNKIIIGDARDMKDVSDESTHLVVTTPPYWQLKDYRKQEQIGFNETYEKYVNNLNLYTLPVFIDTKGIVKYKRKEALREEI